jgi:hypothetical protein
MILLLLLIGVTVHYSIPEQRGIDPGLVTYLDHVVDLSDGNLQYKDLHIHYKDLPKSVAGRCYPLRKEIFIDKKFFKRTGYYGKILLLAHEISHCHKYSNHITGLDKWGCSLHYMDTKFRGRWCDRINFKRYVEQMKRI